MYPYRYIKQRLLGRPLHNSAFVEERLSNPAALAVLSSDALSSVAYATEEILLVLVLAGSGALGLSLPIAGGILLLLGVITLSYRQTIRAYPSGGGAYTVASENLGLYPGLVAGASLLIDYVLTVTVSVCAGIAALTSALPSLTAYIVPLCLVAIALVSWVNLRGLRSAGNLLMLPTYGFIASIFSLIIWGILHPTSATAATGPNLPVQHPLTLFLLLRAFAAGCTALTGIEAISNGVMAFKTPEWQNARRTMLAMSLTLGVMFAGITLLAHQHQIIPIPGQTVLSQLARQIWGTHGMYYVLQGFTLFVLLLAANTSFADFPRLASLLARDEFLPKQLALLGDRLVFSNGILLLSLCAGLLVILFQGQVNAIIPLYAVGVFTSFTLSQLGMVVHWRRVRQSGWLVSALINSTGAAATLVVLGVIVSTKFLQGAWMVVLLIPLMVGLCLMIRRHYRWVEQRLRLHSGGNPSSVAWSQRPALAAQGGDPAMGSDRVMGSHPAIVLISQLHRGSADAIAYARTIADEVVAVHVNIGMGLSSLPGEISDPEAELQRRWQQFEADIPLVVLSSPYRSVVEPVVAFVEEFERQHLGYFSTVIVPVLVPRQGWDALLHNQTARLLQNALKTKRSRVVTWVRYYL